MINYKMLNLSTPTIDAQELLEYKQHKKMENGLPSIVHICGDNGLGKSTFFHIIALAFLALKRNDGIHKSLKEKIENLISSRKTLEFELFVNDSKNDRDIVISKNKDSNDIKISYKGNDNNPDVPPHKFCDDYELIYDIPTNPIERIDNTLDYVQKNQTKIATTIGRISMI